MTHPPLDPKPVDVIACRLHEQARWRAVWWPAWEDLDLNNPFEAGLIWVAYDQARDFAAMYIRGKE